MSVQEERSEDGPFLLKISHPPQAGLWAVPVLREEKMAVWNLASQPQISHSHFYPSLYFASNAQCSCQTLRERGTARSLALGRSARSTTEPVNPFTPRVKPWVNKCDCTFWVCGWNPSAWPFKWKLLSSTFMWWCLFLTILQNEIQDFLLRF